MRPLTILLTLCLLALPTLLPAAAAEHEGRHQRVHYIGGGTHPYTVHLYMMNPTYPTVGGAPFLFQPGETIVDLAVAPKEGGPVLWSYEITGRDALWLHGQRCSDEGPVRVEVDGTPHRVKVALADPALSQLYCGGVPVTGTIDVAFS